MPVSTIPDDTVIYNTAHIIFDTNAPIATGTWFNTIDRVVPTSFVNALAPTTYDTSFAVSWYGTDDGAGIVQTIEVLRTFKALGYKPKHTIRFVLFANEENGGRGADKYLDEAKAKNENHLFALESDAGGFTPRGFNFTGSATQLSRLRSWILLLMPYGTHEINEGGAGADIDTLNKIFKIPIAGLSPDSQRYFDYHHAETDVFEAVSKRELDLGAANMTALIWLVSEYGL